jgi:DNA-directed RNA polymerase specialized sigma24 family protein
MSTSGSVTHWLRLLQSGEPEAAQPLWECYFQRLVDLARAKLGAIPRRVADEEDIALSAFNSFCQGAQKGKFPKLSDRNDLWRLLVVITARKALDFANYQRRRKRGGVAAQLGTLAPADHGDEAGEPLEQVIGKEPTPEFAAQVAEEYRRLLELLKDDELRRVAVSRMEGYSNEEIAEQLSCAVRSVERRLRVIRALWSEETNA